MVALLTLVSGVAWTFVYVQAIRLGFRQRTYAMPVAALGLNFAWECIYAAEALSSGVISLQGSVNVVWAVADLVIVYTFFRFGRAEFPSFVSARMFVVGGLGLFAISFLVQWLFIVAFGSYQAVVYSAFLQNALMSGLFIAFFLARRGLRGQSISLALAKWLGTLAPTLSIGLVSGFVPFVLGLGFVCSVLDLTYLGLLVWAKRNPAALRG